MPEKFSRNTLGKILENLRHEIIFSDDLIIAKPMCFLLGWHAIPLGDSGIRNSICRNVNDQQSYYIAH